MDFSSKNESLPRIYIIIQAVKLNILSFSIEIKFPKTASTGVWESDNDQTKREERR